MHALRGVPSGLETGPVSGLRNFSRRRRDLRGQVSSDRSAKKLRRQRVNFRRAAGAWCCPAARYWTVGPDRLFPGPRRQLHQHQGHERRVSGRPTSQACKLPSLGSLGSLTVPFAGEAPAVFRYISVRRDYEDPLPAEDRGVSGVLGNDHRGSNIYSALLSFRESGDLK